jgi:chromate transporter
MILIKLFLEFFKIGTFTFGGGQVMLPIMKRELVVNLNWISMQNFLHFVSIAEVTPGPVAINMATFIGYELHGIIGAIFSTAGVVAPSFIIIILIAMGAKKFRENRIYQAFMSGVRPVLPVLLINAIYLIVAGGFKSIAPYIIALATFFVFAKWRKINPVLLLIIAGIVGILIP